jgi:Zn-dependent metalloprotease
MKKLSALVAACAAIFGLLQYDVSGQSAAGPIRVPALANDVGALRTWDKYVTDGSRAGALRLKSSLRDPMVPAHTAERYDQFHDGVRIWGADVVRDSQGGIPVSVFGAVAPDLTLSTTPSIAADAAAQRMTALGGAGSVVLRTPELVIVPLAAEYRLAYTAPVSVGSAVFRTFVDAASGAELLRYSEIQTVEAVGTGTGVLGDRKKLSVDSSAGLFYAYDTHRPPIIETFDLRGNLARFKQLDAGLASYTLADFATDADNVWTDPAVVDAHVHVSWTYDFYFKRFGRSGLDGRNSPINIVTNVVSQQGALSLTGADINYALNASWCGVCGPGGQGRMFFGNGIPSNFVFGGQNYTYFAGALDIVAHELTHGVTEATSGLIYLNESGALNESFSDIMGKAAEFFFHPGGAAAGQADYILGKDIVRGLVPGVPNGNRSLANPAIYGQPDHYSGRYTGTEDGGGVHINSGISNHAFYLAVEGGTNRTSNLAVQGVGAANREQIEKVFYRAFTALLPANATFSLARATTIQAARDLYGAGSNPERAVTQAWTAVGVN